MRPLQTERLLLRDFQPSDLADYSALRRGERFGRYYAESEVSPAFSQQLLAMFLAWQAERPRRCWQLAIVAQAGDELLGSCGVRQFAPGCLSLGFELGERHWGQGYAFEAVGALLDFAHRELACREVVADTLADNAPAIALLQRLGFVTASEAIPAREFKGLHWPGLRMRKIWA